MSRKGTALYLALFAVIVVLHLLGVIHVYAQQLPQVESVPAPTIALYVHPGVKVFNVGVPKVSPFQKTTRAAVDCNLTASEKVTKVCVTVWADERDTNMPVAKQRIVIVEMNDFDFSRMKHLTTNASGYVTAKVSKQSELFIAIKPDGAYGYRAGQFHQIKDLHVNAIFEMTKR